MANNKHRNNKNYGNFPKPSDKELREIITDPEKAETVVKWAEKIGEALSRYLTTSQIRAIFGEVRRIEGDWKSNPIRAKRNLILLKPKMAYRAKKERGNAVGDLVSVLSPAINCVVEVKDDNECTLAFTRFVDFFEAILAYHKAYGGN